MIEDPHSKCKLTFETIRTTRMKMGKPVHMYLTADNIMDAMAEVNSGGYDGLNELMTELLKDYLEERSQKEKTNGNKTQVLALVG